MIHHLHWLQLRCCNDLVKRNYFAQWNFILFHSFITVLLFSHFLLFQINVVSETRNYTTWDEAKESPAIIPARVALNKLHVWLAEHSYTQVSFPENFISTCNTGGQEEFNVLGQMKDLFRFNPWLEGLMCSHYGQKWKVWFITFSLLKVYVDQRTPDIIAITRHNPVTHEKVIMLAHTAFNRHAICHNCPAVDDLRFAGNISFFIESHLDIIRFVSEHRKDYNVYEIWFRFIGRSSSGNRISLRRQRSPRYFQIATLRLMLRSYCTTCVTFP